MKRDILIVGGGPAGASCAMFLAEQGIKASIIEMEQFPRYHIGESLTGGGGKALRDLGLEDEMNGRGHPRKEGVKVYGTSSKNSWFVGVTGRDENWVQFDWHTWQVRRSDFDTMMLKEAVRRGAELLPGRAVKPLMNDDGSVRGVLVHPEDGGTLEIETQLVLDCTGQATWLANHGGVTGPKYLGAYDRQVAFFSQVAGAVRDDGNTRDTDKDNTLIFYEKKYHWSWFIPLDEEVVSVGVVVPSALFVERKLSKRDFFVAMLYEINPELRRRVPEINLVEDVHVIPNYSYQVNGFTGKGFICIGDAHRFIDPIFSFGVTVAMREAQFVAPLARAYLEGANRNGGNPFADYELFCEKGIDVLEDMIDLFWEQPFAFAVAVHQRYTDYMRDMLAGRIYDYERQPSPAALAFRKILGRQEERERSYMERDLYSMPIGSRFHPERAPLWEPNALVATTEEWLGPR